jgi:hypothetical protein
MTAWIRADVDFGVPYKAFTIRTRRALELGFFAPNEPFKADFSSEEHALATEQQCLALIVACRPELQGAMVTGVGLDIARKIWVFQVIHPSIKRDMGFFCTAAERLECCPTCRKPLPESGIWLERDEEDNYVEYCSPVCAGKEGSWK